MSKPESKKSIAASRRRFLTTMGAAGGLAAVGTLATPQISRAQTAVLKMQGSWGAKDVFNEMAEDYVKRVNELGGGRLKIDYLLGGAEIGRAHV